MDLTYAGLVVLGAGMLIPWNAFVSAADFFEYRYPGRHSDRLFTVCYLPVQLVTLLVLIWQHDRFGPYSFLRIALGYSGFTGVLLFVIAVEAATRGRSSFALILLSVVATGIFDGIAQGALFGQFNKLPPQYTQAIVAGTAISGTLASALRVATKAVFSDSPRGLEFGAYLYFSMAAVVCFCCVIVYTRLLPNQPIVRKYCVDDGPSKQSSDVLEDDQELELTGSDLHSDSATAAEAERCLNGEVSSTGQHGNLLSGLTDSEQPAQPLGLLGVLYHTRALTISLVLIYTITLAIFPGFLVEDVHSAELRSWYPVLLIAGFNVADLLGKSLPLRGPFAGAAASRLALACSVLRLLFVPAFLLTAELGASPVIIGLLTVALGVSNGFLTSVAIVRTSLGLRTQSDQQLAGNLAVLALVGGLSLGASCSFLWLL